jgi:hypothetical protein
MIDYNYLRVKSLKFYINLESKLNSCNFTCQCRFYHNQSNPISQNVESCGVSCINQQKTIFTSLDMIIMLHSIT